MANAKWPIPNGQCQMANAKWANAKWPMPNGQCQMPKGQRQMAKAQKANAKWPMIDGQCQMDNGRQKWPTTKYALCTCVIIKVGVGKGYDGHVVKGISKTAIFEKNDALPS